jgi:ribonuclease HII
MLREYKVKSLLVGGCDEAGRGCLAGPVFAACVILPPKFRHPLLNDSKKMKPEERIVVRKYILKKALAWGIAMCDHEEIDRVNILQASFLAMHRAIEQMNIKPDLLLIDGNRFNDFKGIPYECVIGGDGIYKNIAAASVLAKTSRDEYMQELHKVHPEYGWDHNKAYATPGHRDALVKFGLTPFHRRSFRLDYQLELDFELEED